MVIADKLMVNDCYQGDAKQALFISSFAGAALGLVVTSAYWFFGGTDTTILWEILTTWWSSYGLLIFVAGALSAQVLYHYFHCLSEDTDSTIIASWLAATPIFVFVFSLILLPFGLLFDEIKISPWAVCGIILTSCGLALLERYSYDSTRSEGKYWHHLAAMVLLSVLYIVLIDQTLGKGIEHTNIGSHDFILALLPAYWLGFAIGMRVMIKKENRISFGENIPLLRQYFIPILIMELLGMGVFFFEFLSLEELDSVTSSIIIGLHVIPVWIVSVILTHYNDSLKRKGRHSGAIFRFQLNTEMLDAFRVRKGSRLFQLICIIAIILGLTIFVLA